MGIINNIFNLGGSVGGVVAAPTSPLAGVRFVNAAADLVPSNQTVGKAVVKTVRTAADLNDSINNAGRRAGIQIMTAPVRAINKVLGWFQ